MDTILFCGLTMYAWITIATILVMFIVLSVTKLPADLVFMAGMTVLFVSGVLSTEEALSGFSSESVVTIGVLFVVVAGLMYSGVVQWIVRYVLGTPSSFNKAVVRLMLPVAALSSVLSNTSVVALFLNVVKVWAKKLGIAPSRLLIPLSYASGMGGVCTLIGTPPNLIISGFYAKDTGEALNIFTTLLPGLFCLAVGVISILALRRLLPDRQSADDSFESTSDYTVELLVPADCPSIGQTVTDAQLMNVKGGHLIEIVRFDREIISPVPEDEFIMGGDRLIYSGQIDTILELKRTHHLVNATHPVFTLKEIEKGRRLRTASIGMGCSLIGTTMSENSFEQDHGVVLVAVSRRGERIEASPRDIKLNFGDVLLLECPSSFKVDSVPARDGLRFFDSEAIPNIGKQTLVSSIIMLAMILLTAFSRNYLGVHTPQDVLVSMALSGGYLWLNGKVAARLARQPGFDLTVAAVGVAASLAAVAWFSLKSYPLDYAGGALLVDPVLMMEDGFMAAGMVFGFYPGWLIERRWLRFTTSRRALWQYALAAVALGPMLLLYKALPGVLAAWLGPLWAEFVSCALLAFYVMALVPALICRLQRRKQS